MYDVIVTNLGTVYHGDDLDTAQNMFNLYVAVSKGEHGGRASGEDVFVLEGQPSFRGIVHEYLGPDTHHEDRVTSWEDEGGQ